MTPSGLDAANTAAECPPPGNSSDLSVSGSGDGQLPRLSRRERQLLEGVVDGLSNAQIARHLGLQTQTVKNMLTVIYEKAGVKNRLQLAVYALRSGLVGFAKYEGT